MILACALAGGVAASPRETRAQVSNIQRVAWLQGCWVMTDGDRTVEEHWMAPRGTSMIGIGRTMRGTKLTEYELVLLSDVQDRLAYEAHPSGQPSATFLSIEISSTRVVFENKAHDFPQRVGYELRAPGSLLAWIEGTSSRGQVRVEFPYRRVACD